MRPYAMLSRGMGHGRKYASPGPSNQANSFREFFEDCSVGVATVNAHHQLPFPDTLIIQPIAKEFKALVPLLAQIEFSLLFFVVFSILITSCFANFLN